MIVITVIADCCAVNFDPIILVLLARSFSCVPASNALINVDSLIRCEFIPPSYSIKSYVQTPSMYCILTQGWLSRLSTCIRKSWKYFFNFFNLWQVKNVHFRKKWGLFDTREVEMNLLVIVYVLLGPVQKVVWQVEESRGPYFFYKEVKKKSKKY